MGFELLLSLIEADGKYRNLMHYNCTIEGEKEARLNKLNLQIVFN